MKKMNCEVDLIVCNWNKACHCPGVNDLNVKYSNWVNSVCFPHQLVCYLVVTQ